VLDSIFPASESEANFIVVMQCGLHGRGRM